MTFLALAKIDGQTRRGWGQSMPFPIGCLSRTIVYMNGDKRILAIETTGRAGSVCVASGETVLGREELASDARHASGLHTAVDRLVRGQGWRPDALDEVYVSAGPGSFTGARIGITVARTLAWATGARIVRVPTVDALAHNALEAVPPPEYVAVVLDAKRSQIFTALFALVGTKDSVPHPGGVGHPGLVYEKIIDATLVEPGEFLTKTVADRIASVPHPGGVGHPARALQSLTPEGWGTRPVVAVLGEGMEYHRMVIEQAGVLLLPRELWSARAEAVHAVGYRMAAAGLYCEPGDCVPIYVRIPEPEEKWLAKEATKRRSDEAT
jgi:tRNA threonylcarbamoyl adenosine modification protein YeaZ